jgi:FkbM family methyltransferase
MIEPKIPDEEDFVPIPVPPPQHWLFRQKTFDKSIWGAVVEKNEYQLCDLSAADVVMDLGCHVGTFSYLAWLKGCRKIFSYEMDAENYKMAVHNLKPYNVYIEKCAVIGWDQIPGKIRYKENKFTSEEEIGLRNTGGYYLANDGEYEVETRYFDDLVDKVLNASINGKIKALKIDVEGAEWPILFSSKKLHVFDSVLGEYHLWGPGEGRGAKEIKELFYDQGFIVKCVPHKTLSYSQGNFWAYRKPLMSEYAADVVTLDGSYHFLWGNHGHALGDNLLPAEDRQFAQ